MVRVEAVSLRLLSNVCFNSRPTLNRRVYVVVETSSSLIFPTGFCYFMSKNAHLKLVRILFSTGGAFFDFVPDAKYAPTTEITCVGIDIDGRRHESHISIDYHSLSNQVRTAVLQFICSEVKSSNLVIFSPKLQGRH